MDTSCDTGLLVKGLGKNLGAFVVEEIIPDDNNPSLVHCYIRSLNSEEFWGEPEHDQAISVGHYADRRLMGFYIRERLELPDEAYEWAIDYLNERAQNEAQFVTASLERIGVRVSRAESSQDEEIDYIMLECSYQLSTVPYTGSRNERQKAMSPMVKDIMVRLHSEAYEILRELECAYETYLNPAPSKAFH